MISLLSALFLIPSAFSWDQHQIIMERILSSPMALNRVDLDRRIRIPCAQDEKKELLHLATELNIQLSKVPLFSNTECEWKSPQELSVRNLMVSRFVDEPDFGMDQDLPDSADPNHAREWMGGRLGPTSQGFRHMVFPGFRWGSPIATLQIPFHQVGEALERIGTLRRISNRYFEGQNYFWAIRTLMWELHYVQDLHQPFHVTQIPSLGMIPFSRVFEGIIPASTQTMANYHYAFEGITLEMIRDPSEGSLRLCLQESGSRVFHDPAELMSLPRSRAPSLGRLLVQILGDGPKSPAVNLPEGVGKLNYTRFLQETDLKGITCELLREMTRYVWGEIDRHSGLEIQSSSNKTGK